MAKTVRNNLHLMNLNPTQQAEINKAGGMDRELCAIEGCYKLRMVRGKNSAGVVSYKTVCSRHNNEASHLKEMNHRKHLLKVTNVNCDDCNTNLKVVDVEVHHIDGNHFNNNRENLKNLCSACHKVYTLAEKQFESYEKRFGCTKTEMRDKMKKSGHYYGKGK